MPFFVRQTPLFSDSINEVLVLIEQMLFLLFVLLGKNLSHHAKQHSASASRGICRVQFKLNFNFNVNCRSWSRRRSRSRNPFVLVAAVETNKLKGDYHHFILFADECRLPSALSPSPTQSVWTLFVAVAQLTFLIRCCLPLLLLARFALRDLDTHWGRARVQFRLRLQVPSSSDDFCIRSWMVHSTLVCVFDLLSLPLAAAKANPAKQWNRASAAAVSTAAGANCCCRSLCMVSRSIGYRGTFGFRRQSVSSRCSDCVWDCALVVVVVVVFCFRCAFLWCNKYATLCVRTLLSLCVRECVPCENGNMCCGNLAGKCHKYSLRICWLASK